MNWSASTACVVRKLDPNPLPLLIEEMQSRSPLRRRYAVMAADAMGLASEVEPQIRHLLSDDDHMVRKEAAKSVDRLQSPRKQRKHLAVPSNKLPTISNLHD